MNNPNLGRDYRIRARGRKVAIDALFNAALYADVVRECQEAAELALKSIIREAGHSVPMTHEVSQKLREIRQDLPPGVQNQLDRLCDISKTMRRDRELSFYGSEDLTPSEFYTLKDAETAMAMLDEVLAVLP
jgi:HEPN domain-containing protein